MTPMRCTDCDKITPHTYDCTACAAGPLRCYACYLRHCRNEHGRAS